MIKWSKKLSINFGNAISAYCQLLSGHIVWSYWVTVLLHQLTITRAAWWQSQSASWQKLGQPGGIKAGLLIQLLQLLQHLGKILQLTWLHRVGWGTWLPPTSLFSLFPLSSIKPPTSASRPWSSSWSSSSRERFRPPGNNQSKGGWD